MKKVLFEINSGEKNRILEMHQTATRKQYLMENASDDDKIMALDIAKLLDDLTGRYDIDLTKLPEDTRYMFRILGDLQNDIAVDLIPNYSVPRTKDPGWSTLYNVVKKSATISNDVSISLNEFFDKLVEMIKKYFPNDDLSEVKDLINNFNIELDKYKY
jgi:hypothetical protein